MSGKYTQMRRNNRVEKHIIWDDWELERTLKRKRKDRVEKCII